MILITGAGGKTGRTLVKILSKVESVCAFVHREEHVSAAQSLGAEKVIVGDLLDEAAVEAAEQAICTALGHSGKVHRISALTGAGTARLAADLMTRHEQMAAASAEQELSSSLPPSS